MTDKFKVDMKNGEHIYRHENTKIWQKYEIVNGKPHGKWLYFHIDGKPSIEEVYENGKKQGTWKSWHGSGEQWTEETYTDGKKNGVSKRWRWDGIKEYTGRFKDDKRHGKWVNYFDNGFKMNEGKYKNNKRDGKWLEYHLDSESISNETNYKDGNKTGEYTKYYIDDRLEITGNYLENKRDGQWKWYIKDTAWKTIEYKGGLKEGKYKELHPNGKTWKNFRFKRDKLQGECITYNVEGVMTNHQIWMMGEKHKKGFEYHSNGLMKKSTSHKKNGKHTLVSITTYYPSGKTSSIKTYRDDKLHGEYIEKHSNGNKRATGTIDSGNMDGEWQFFYEHGEVESQLIFKNGELIEGNVFDEYGVPKVVR
tara:strand:- start:2419 stop:3513 length:1095 start_codon:yes stop_codon:yes gene_type:complete